MDKAAGFHDRYVNPTSFSSLSSFWLFSLLMTSFYLLFSFLYVCEAWLQPET